ncbi:DUF397 domain-containing protein [Streptomyces sp. URMC 123]|uniref:DUF397 domain-containing protein n=1 Tax=Streptomyces sp. URMC 123 TaxID=3423403 RepID=UPI003F1DADBE
MSDLIWHKAALEEDGLDAWIEVAKGPDGMIHLRHSDRPEEVVTTSRAKWEAFVLGVKNDEFDHFAGL